MNSKYDKNLKYVESILGNGITNGGQLYKLAHKLFRKKFIGVFDYKQHLPELNVDECMILNQKTNEHWIAMANICGTIYKYDSFDRKSYIIPYKDGDFDGAPDQNILETNCGSRCIAWLITVYDHE